MEPNCRSSALNSSSNLSFSADAVLAAIHLIPFCLVAGRIVADARAYLLARAGRAERVEKGADANEDASHSEEAIRADNAQTATVSNGDDDADADADDELQSFASIDGGRASSIGMRSATSANEADRGRFGRVGGARSRETPTSIYLKRRKLSWTKGDRILSFQRRNRSGKSVLKYRVRIGRTGELVHPDHEHIVTTGRLFVEYLKELKGRRGQKCLNTLTRTGKGVAELVREIKSQM